MIIFDEASQVHTEDAMGAIMRGKQIIIVGDTKQLPPTNFFSTSLNEDDFDVDEEEDQKDNDAGAFESILDESVTFLPERSLRWHYRSRDEHLIAFSNIKIYHNSLITFPSSIEKAADIGVEYVYVENGIYDRSGRRNNVMEAQRVAKLVSGNVVVIER
jgi:superfamily I DNA and/or RNA helicase